MTLTGALQDRLSSSWYVAKLSEVILVDLGKSAQKYDLKEFVEEAESGLGKPGRWSRKDSQTAD